MKVQANIEDVLDWLPATHAARTGVNIDRADLLAYMKEALARL